MIIDFEKKRILCDCGDIVSMDGLPVHHCPDCDRAFYHHDDNCGSQEITALVYNYIDSYQKGFD